MAKMTRANPSVTRMSVDVQEWMRQTGLMDANPTSRLKRKQAKMNPLAREKCR